jgi:transcription initiation factor TFIID subunit 2
MPSLPTSTSFLRAVLDPKCFYKIRMEAAYGLASCAIPSLNWVGLHQLNKMFNKRYCFPVSSFAQSAMEDDELPMVTSIPKPNNFTSLPDYFIQKASVVAFSQIRDDRGLTPVRIRQFLLDLLKYNDNIGNEFSDCYYVATLVSSLGDSLIPANDDAIDDIEGEHVNAAAKAEIERFRTLDYVIPTYHNIITVTCLRTMTKLMLKELLPVNISMFMQYTRYGNYLEIRLMAFDSLFILCGLSDHTLNQYLLNVIKEDPCVYVSHYVARAMLAWLGLAMKENSDTPTNPTRYVEEFAEEEGRVIIDDDRLPVKKTAQQEFQASIESLRKRFENDIELQQNLWDLLKYVFLTLSINLSVCINMYIL